MKMTREKKILLSLLMCGAVCNAAYAATPPSVITGDQSWNIGTDDNEYQFTAGNYTISAGSTVTMMEQAASNVSAVLDGNGGVLNISSDSEGETSSLVIQGIGGSSGYAISNSGADSAITLTDVDLKIDSYGTAIYGNGTDTITINNKNTALTNCGVNGIDVTGYASVEINTGAFSLSMGESNSVENAIEVQNYGSITINADTINITNYDTNSRGAYTGTGIFNQSAVGEVLGGAGITLTGREISITHFDDAVYLQAGGLLNITSTEELNISDNSTAGIWLNADEARVNIKSSGTININNNGRYGINVQSDSSGTEDAYSVNITGDGDTVINLIGNNTAGLQSAYAPYGIHITNAAAVNISDTLEGAGIWIQGATTEHGVDIENVNTVTIDTCDVGIYLAYNASDAVNITNVKDLKVQNCINSGEGDDTGIYSIAAHGVNVTVADGGSVTISGNGTGIQTSAVDGVTIKGVSGDYFPKLKISGNASYGLYVNGGGSLNFSANELVAEDNAILAYATASGSAINLTADEATITGQTENASDDYTLYARNGASINLNVKDITASRDSGYFAYADTNTASTINITADKGTIEGAFWSGATDNTTADSSGTINLNLGTSAEWTVTDNSKVTNLTMGDDSGLVFSYLGGNDDAEKFLNLYTSSMNSGSGSSSNITMNINGGALDQSDHIYVNGEHSGTSIINLVGNGTDLTDDVIGTRLVSVVTENGSFIAGAKYEGALAWYEYKLNSVDQETDGGTKYLSNGKTVTNTEGYNTDWYIDGYAETDAPDTNPNPEPDPEPTPDPEPDPDKPDGDGGPGPAQPNGNTTTVNAVIAANAVNYYAFRETDKLLRRMGELRNNGEDEQGVWIRVKGAKTGRNGSFENKYVHYEGGYDHLVKNDHREKRYEGVSISHTEGDVKYKEVTGSGKAHDEEIAFYRVDQYKHGHYLDLVTRIGIYNNRFGVYDTNQNKIHGKNHNYGISTSAEYGRKKDYAHGWYVEPQTQATLGYLSGSDYTTSNQVDVSNGSISSAVGRIGVNIGKGFTDKNGRRGKFYAKANWLKEFLGSYGIDMVSNAGNRVHAHGNYKDTWFEWGFGVTYQYTKNNFFYADVEKTHGSAYYKNWAWNVGLRWTFN